MKEEGVSPYRWCILLSTIPIIISTEMMWLTLSPISSAAEAYYHVSTVAVTMFTTSYMIMFIIFSIPASYVIDRFGFRISLLIGAGLTAVFGLGRLMFAENFTAVIICQFLIAVGQPFILNVTTKVAANWFPFKERATAAGLLTMAQYLGFAIPMVLSPILAEQYSMKGVFLVPAAAGVVSVLLIVIFSKEKPAVPPPGPLAPKEDFSLQTIRELMKKGPYMRALIICFISMGIFNTLLTLIESVLLPRGISSMEAGIIGAAFVLAGVAGAIVLPIVSDKTGKRIPFFVTAISALVPLYLGLTLVSDYLLLTIIAGTAGFLIMGVAPILFQHGSEVAYPVQEGTSLGFILLMGQISGVLFVFIFELLSQNAGSIVVPMLLIVAITALEIPITAKMKESVLMDGKNQ